MLTGLDISERVEFVSASDTGDPKTIFVLGNLPAKFKLALAQEAYAQNVGETGKFSGDIFPVLLHGIKEIRNLINKKTGEPENIKTVTSEVIEQIPLDVIGELAGKIMTINFVSEQERKN